MIYETAQVRCKWREIGTKQAVNSAAKSQLHCLGSTSPIVEVLVAVSNANM
jgi:hypothetical protein